MPIGADSSLKQTRGVPSTLIHFHSVPHKFVSAQRNLLPSLKLRKPVPFVFASNTAMSSSFPSARTRTCGFKNPARLKVQLSSALSAVASDPTLFIHRSVAKRSSEIRSSYSAFTESGCFHINCRPTAVLILFTNSFYELYAKDDS